MLVLKLKIQKAEPVTLIPSESQLQGATLFQQYVAPILESICKCIMIMVAIMMMLAIMIPMMTEVIMELPMMWRACEI